MKLSVYTAKNGRSRLTHKSSDTDSLWLQMIQKTELQLAKTEPFAEASQPVTLF